MKKKIIIGVTGTLGSGKSTATRYIIDHFRAEHHRFSEILEEILKILSLPKERKNFSDLALGLRNQFGEDVLVNAMFERIMQSSADVVIADGFRKKEEVERFRELDGFTLVFLEVDPKIAYKRIVKRGEKSDDANKTFEEFMEDARHKTDAEIPELRERSNYILENNGIPEELHVKIDEMMEKLDVTKS
jgi:dephospho-CoA kinase